MNDDLDGMLLRSKPDLAERSPGLTSALDELVGAAPPATRRRWLPAVTGGFLLFALAGGASIAAATPGVLDWFGWTDNTTSYSRGDEVCHEGFRVMPASEESDAASPSLLAAREYLAALDIDTVDITAKLAEFERNGNEPRNPESSARSSVVYDLTIAYVAGLGLPTADISLESGGMCDGGER